MRQFYSDYLLMKEVAYYHEDEHGWLVYDCGSFKLMIFPSYIVLEESESWGMQPGWQGGTEETISWSVLVPEADFPATVARLKEAGVNSYFEQPQWLQESYWGFPVMDPMGNTVEVFTNPAEPSNTAEWTE